MNGKLLEGTDVCYAPVLNLREAPEHPHNKERQTFTEIEGVINHLLHQDSVGRLLQFKAHLQKTGRILIKF